MSIVAILPVLLALTAAPPPDAVPPVRRVMLTAFQRVRVTGPYVVEVVTGGATGAELRGDRKASERVSVQVDAGTLSIRPLPATQDGFAPRSGPMTIRIATRSALNGVTVLGGARVTVDRLAGSRVDAVLNGTGALGVGAVAAEQVVATLVGTGTLTLAGKARQARFAASGSGTVDAAALEAEDLVVRSEGAGTARFRARRTADVTANGAGTIEVDGAPKCQMRGTAAIRCGAPPSG